MPYEHLAFSPVVPHTIRNGLQRNFFFFQLYTSVQLIFAVCTFVSYTYSFIGKSWNISYQFFCGSRFLLSKCSLLQKSLKGICRFLFPPGNTPADLSSGLFFLHLPSPGHWLPSTLGTHMEVKTDIVYLQVKC